MKQFPECSTDGELISAGDVSKCLGCCWREDLVATRAVEENITNEGSEKLFPVWWYRYVPRRPQHTSSRSLSCV